MSIWHHKPSLEQLNSWGQNTMLSHLGITFTDLSDDTLTAQMPVDARTHQPYGIMHGGASCVLAETVGSTAGQLCLDHTKFFVLGLSINTNHLKVAMKGVVTAVAQPIHVGRTTQVWEVKISNEQGALVSITRMTNLVRERKGDRLNLDFP